MNFPASHFDRGWTLAAWLPLLGAIAWAVRTAPWRQVGEPGRIHLLAGAVVVLSLLWSMKAGIRPGLDLHLVGAMVLVLAFGPQLALLALIATVIAMTLNGSGQWGAFAWNALVLGVLPVAVANAIHRLVQRHLPNHLFIYIFVVAFLGSAVTMGAIGIGSTVLLWAAGAYRLDYLASEYLPYYLLLGFSEAWISGMAVTLMVVYRPSWITTFEDARYLSNR